MAGFGGSRRYYTPKSEVIAFKHLLPHLFAALRRNRLPRCRQVKIEIDYRDLTRVYE